MSRNKRLTDGWDIGFQVREITLASRSFFIQNSESHFLEYFGGWNPWITSMLPGKLKKGGRLAAVSKFGF